MSWRRHHEWEHIAFNAAAPAASIWVGAHVLFFVARVPPLLQIPAPITSLILPLLLLSLVDFLCNSALMAIAIGLEPGGRPLTSGGVTSCGFRSVTSPRHPWRSA